MALLDFKGDYGSDTRPARSVAARKAWAKDPSTPTGADGTRLDATFVNDFVAMLRHLATVFSVPAVAGDDEFLADVIAAAVSNSPALTGTPTAPTAAPGTNTTQIANTAFVAAAIAALLNSAPGALDTLDELAAALADDPNFATTITNALALKAPLASPTLTGTPTAPTAAPGTNTTQIANTAFVAAAVTAVPGLSDGDKGQIVVSGGGTIWNLDTGAAVANIGYTPQEQSANLTSWSTISPAAKQDALGYTPWHAGNDGPGSGLDADTLDGLSSAAFAVASHVHGAGDITSGKLSNERLNAAVVAWVRFNQDGTIAASYNVASITDNGAGDWTVNFSSALSDANYAVLATVEYAEAGASAHRSMTVGINYLAAPSTTAVRIAASTGASAGTLADNDIICVAVIR